MADPATDQFAVIIVLFVIVLAVLTYFELKLLRKKMKNRRVRTAKREDQLPDEAHNAIVTTKAILSSMERQQVRSQEASTWVREAEFASARGNYRVAIDLTVKAKERLLSLKAAQATKGDLVKLDRLATSEASDEMTTKELIQKEFPPNLMQSKFSIEMATTAIESGGSAGRDVTQAAQLLESAKTRFDAKDYTGALALARQSKRASEGKPVELTSTLAPAASVDASRPCPKCGATLQPDDAFCRKCGTRLIPTACASCGANLLADDAFCRKCGSPVSR